MLTSSDIVGLLVSYAYAIGLLVAGEGLRRFAGVPPHVTRKLIHIGAGMWVFGVLALFSRWQVGVVPFASFIVVNALLYRYRAVGAMDSEDSSHGTIYFAAAIALLFAVFWRPEGPVDRLLPAVCGVMALTWGDALAALIGRRFGRHRYTIFGSNRSWEGSAVMLGVSALAVLLTLLLLPGSALAPLAPPVGPGRATLAALVAALVGTAVEGGSPHGSDNLTVPLAVAAAVAFVTMA